MADSSERKEVKGAGNNLETPMAQERADWEMLSGTGQGALIGPKLGHPIRSFDAQKAEIEEAYQRCRFGAQMLERIMRKVYKIGTAHNCIYM
jgi:hypothetical protein